MTPKTPQDVKLSFSRLYAKLKNKIVNGVLMVFRPSGRIVNKPIREWVGSVASNAGLWSVDISGAGFTEILHVSPVCITTNTDFNLQATANVTTVSTTTVSGRAYQGSTSVIISNNLGPATNGTIVMVRILGV